ncbi:MAG: chorismate-binding protein, partial [Pseudomonadota bacterium]
MDEAPAMVALIDFPGPDGTRQRWAFGPALRWLVADRADQVQGVLDQAHALAKQGRWCVGWVSFEAASAFDACLPIHPSPAGYPLALFAVFDHSLPWPARPPGSWQTQPWQSPLPPQAFEQQIEAIHDWIRAGEVYQINLTSPLSSQLGPDTPSTPLAYFRALHRSQPDGYASYLDITPLASTTPGYSGPDQVLSASPELFFHWQEGRITTRPMKGTAARGDTPQADAAAAHHLQTSDKERAENLMIVDLLRNDLSRIAQVGSVQVPSLFDVQALPTVWQMTSTVQAQTRPGLTLSEVFGALFPCGSITGAPKRRAMQHIATLEGSPRGVYCGA